MVDANNPHEVFVESLSVRKTPVKATSKRGGFFRSSTEKTDLDPFQAIPIKKLVEINEIYEMSEPSEGYESTDNNMEIRDSDFDYGSDINSEQEMKSQKNYPARQWSVTPDKSDFSPSNLFSPSKEVMKPNLNIFKFDNSSVQIGPMGKSHCFDIAEEESLNNSNRQVQMTSNKILALAHETSSLRRAVEMEEKVFIRNSQKSPSNKAEVGLDCEANLGGGKKNDGKKIVDRITKGEIFGAPGRSSTGKLSIEIAEREQLPDIGSMGESEGKSVVVENRDQLLTGTDLVESPKRMEIKTRKHKRHPSKPSKDFSDAQKVKLFDNKQKSPKSKIPSKKTYKEDIMTELKSPKMIPIEKKRHLDSDNTRVTKISSYGNISEVMDVNFRSSTTQISKPLSPNSFKPTYFSQKDCTLDPGVEAQVGAPLERQESSAVIEFESGDSRIGLKASPKKFSGENLVTSSLEKLNLKLSETEFSSHNLLLNNNSRLFNCGDADRQSDVTNVGVRLGLGLMDSNFSSPRMARGDSLFSRGGADGMSDIGGVGASMDYGGKSPLRGSSKSPLRGSSKSPLRDSSKFRLLVIKESMADEDAAKMGKARVDLGKEGEGKSLGDLKK